MSKRFTNALICGFMATSLVVLSTGCNRGTAYNGANRVRNDVNRGTNGLKQGGKTIKKDLNNLGNSVMPGANGTGRLSTNIAGADQVSIIQSNCEDIIKDVNNKDWGKAQAKLKTVKRCTKNLKRYARRNANGLRGNINTAGTNAITINGRDLSALIKYVKSLSTGCSQRNSYNCRNAANNVTGVCPYLRNSIAANNANNLSGAAINATKGGNRVRGLTIYDEIDRLKYLTRKVMLDDEKKNSLGARGTFREISRVWTRVDKKLGNTYKDDKVKAVTLLSQFKKAVDTRNSASIGTYAKSFMDQLDVIQKDFVKQVNNKR